MTLCFQCVLAEKSRSVMVPNLVPRHAGRNLPCPPWTTVALHPTTGGREGEISSVDGGGDCSKSRRREMMGICMKTKVRRFPLRSSWIPGLIPLQCGRRCSIYQTAFGIQGKEGERPARLVSIGAKSAIEQEFLD